MGRKPAPVDRQPSPAEGTRTAEDNYCISRLEARGCWRVVVMRKGEKNERDFYDGGHDGRKGAYQAAARYRDEQLADKAPYTMAEFASKLKDHNTSGVTGVCRTKTTRKRLDGSVVTKWYWMASYQGAKKTGAKSGSKWFDIARYGENRAYELAVAARAQILAEQLGDLEAFAPKTPEAHGTLVRAAVLKAAS